MDNKRLVRLRGGFSDRNNKSHINKEMQYEQLDKNSRTKLKNYSFRIIDNYIRVHGYDAGKSKISAVFADELFCIETRSSEYEYSRIEKMIYDVFDKGEYYEVLDTIEFIANKLMYIERFDYWANPINKTYFKEYNELFEEEYIGYRFANNIIVKITNSEEIECINQAGNSIFKSVNEHIDKAVRYISEKDKDYENSIKESVSALETLCSIISEENNKTLGETIKIISKEKKIHPSLKEAILKLYGFASDEPGVRHGSGKEGNDITFDEAKAVLVICSAIINYLISMYK